MFSYFHILVWSENDEEIVIIRLMKALQFVNKNLLGFSWCNWWKGWEGKGSLDEFTWMSVDPSKIRMEFWNEIISVLLDWWFFKHNTYIVMAYCVCWWQLVCEAATMCMNLWLLSKLWGLLIFCVLEVESVRTVL